LDMQTVFNDRRIIVTPYKRPMTKKGFLNTIMFMTNIMIA
jgi:hypothetical protein